MTTAAASDRRAVPPGRAIGLTYRVVVRQLTTRGRVIALTLLSLVSTIAGFALGTLDDASVDSGVRLVSRLGLAGVVPVVALVFGGGAIGDLRDDKTLVYLWLRPMDRWPIVTGAALAALTLATPITMVPLLTGAALAGVGGALVGATAVSAAVGLVAYVALFTLLGTWLRRHIVWGLAYILIWEAFVAQAGLGVARFAIHRYTRSILVELADSRAFRADFGLAAGIVVPLIVGGVALAVATWRLATQDID